MRLLFFTLWSLALWAQPRNITLTKEVPGGVVNLGTVATPTVDNDTGAYVLPVALTFSDATSGAAIWTCSNVGSDCTPNALTNPVTVAVTNTHVCAVAKKVDYTDSAPKCATITLAGGGTIGYTTAGSSTANWDGSLIIGTKFTAPANGANGTMKLYCNSSSGTVNVALGVYSDNAGTPNALLSGASATVGCVAGAPDWQTVTLTGVTWVNGTSYWLVAQTATNAANVTYYRDAGASNQENYGIPGGGWGGSLPGTWPGGGGFENYKLSIYVTY